MVRQINKLLGGLAAYTPTVLFLCGIILLCVTAYVSLGVMVGGFTTGILLVIVGLVMDKSNEKTVGGK